MDEVISDNNSYGFWSAAKAHVLLLFYNLCCFCCGWFFLVCREWMAQFSVFFFLSLLPLLWHRPQPQSTSALWMKTITLQSFLRRSTSRYWARGRTQLAPPSPLWRPSTLTRGRTEPCDMPFLKATWSRPFTSTASRWAEAECRY